MGRLVIAAHHVCNLEKLFLQDNAQAFRQELRATLETLAAIPENVPIIEPRDLDEPSDGLKWWK